MKKLFLIPAILLITIACKKTVIEFSDYAPIEGTIEDIVIEEGLQSYGINLRETFKVSGQENRVLQHSITANSNPSLVTAQVDGDLLLLTIQLGLTGSARLTLRSESPSVFRETDFSLTVTPLGAETAMERARAFFREGDYETSRGYFLLVTRKSNSALYAEAFMGSGFSKMRLEGDDPGYGDLIQSLAFDNGQADARAGLSLLEYAQKKNYGEAIRLGKRVLAANPDYRFSLDPALDKNDLRLNIALSQFALGRYEECLASIILLNPDFDARAGDEDFTDRLLRELNRLALLYG